MKYKRNTKIPINSEMINKPTLKKFPECLFPLNLNHDTSDLKKFIHIE